MNAEEYQSQLLAVIGAARVISLIDVPDLLARIERADSVGAMIDPTLYRAKHKAMMVDKALLEAALPLYVLGKRMEEAEAAKIRNILEG